MMKKASGYSPIASMPAAMTPEVGPSPVGKGPPVGVPAGGQMAPSHAAAVRHNPANRLPKKAMHTRGRNRGM